MLAATLLSLAGTALAITDGTYSLTGGGCPSGTSLTFADVGGSSPTVTIATPTTTGWTGINFNSQGMTGYAVIFDGDNTVFEQVDMVARMSHGNLATAATGSSFQVDGNTISFTRPLTVDNGGYDFDAAATSVPYGCATDAAVWPATHDAKGTPTTVTVGYSAQADNFCAGFDWQCEFGATSQWGSEMACEMGFDDAATEEQLCYYYHLFVAFGTTGDTQTLHCTHAAGTAPCDDTPDLPTATNFCDQYATYCPGFMGTDDTKYYADAAACEANYGLSTNDQASCLWYHLGYHVELTANAAQGGTPEYGSDTPGHCQHAAATSLCTAGTAPTTAAPSAPTTAAPADGAAGASAWAAAAAVAAALARAA